MTNFFPLPTEGDNIDLRQLAQILRRRASIFALCILLCALLAFGLSLSQPKIYQATTNVLVTRSSQVSSADLTGTINLQQTADTYVQFLTMTQVRQMVEKLLEVSIAENAIHASLAPNSQMITVRVEDTDSTRAALIADTLVTVLIQQNEILQAGRYQQTEENISLQISEMEKKLEAVQKELNAANAAALQNQIDDLLEKIGKAETELNTLQALPEPGAAQKDRILQLQQLISGYQQVYNTVTVTGKIVGFDEQVDQLQKNYDLYQKLYLNLLSNLENVRMARLQNTPNVVKVSSAITDPAPVRPRTLFNTTLGGVAGLMLAALLVFLLEYLDDTVKTQEEVERLTELPVLGQFVNVSPEEQKKGLLNVSAQPRSPLAEAFRSLRANLEFSAVNQPLQALLITSAGPGEGKSTLAVNLAYILSQAGKRVTLLDADLRRPSVHTFFNWPNHAGLSDLFRERSSLARVKQKVENLASLSVISAGKQPPNPAELLASERMKDILTQLKQSSDLVIVDSAPALVADAQVLSAITDGVLLVVCPGKTRREDLHATLQQLRRAGARVLGVALNRVTEQRGRYSYRGYSSYAAYYASAAPEEPSPNAS